MSNKDHESRASQDKSATTPQTESEKGLTPRDQMFRDEYLLDLNPFRAAKAAGYADSVARTKAFRWVSSPEQKPQLYYEIQEALKRRSIRTGITADKVLERYWQIATADPNELTQMNIRSCRHCHGINHKFQWIDEDEFNDVLSEAERKQAQLRRMGTPEDELPDLPDDEGGYGFDPRLDPHEDCPRCFGEGKNMLYIASTKRLSPQGQALFAGIKQTKAGVEVLMHDQKAALDQVARHLGMFNDKLTLKGDAENPLEVLIRSLPGNTLKPVDDDKK